MTQDEIIAMAKKTQMPFYWSTGEITYLDRLENFAKLVAAKEQKKWEDQTAVEIHEAVLEEREVCAKVAEHSFGVIGSTIALAIRARGET